MSENATPSNKPKNPVQANLNLMARLVQQFSGLTSSNDRQWVMAEIEKADRELLKRAAVVEPTPPQA